MAKLRVALTITDLEPGGAERCLAELARGIDRRRFEPIVYCLAPPPPQGRSLLPLLEQAGVAVRFLDANRPRHLPGLLHRLTRLFRAERPDLVQSMLFHANFASRLAARRAGISPVVCGIRVAERRSTWHLWLDRRTQHLVERYVCVSRAVADFSRQKGRLPGEKLAVIPNGIDLSRYPATPGADLGQFDIAPGRPTMVLIGRLDRQKGVDWLVEMLPDCFQAMPEADLLIVGQGPMHRALQARCEQLGVAARVHWAGWRADVPSILTACDLLLLPSRWEGMPNVVLEAMASSRPVLASSCEGVAELLGPEAPAQTAPFGDRAAWLAQLGRLLGNPVRRREIGAQNRLRAEHEFSLGSMIGAYEALWAEVAQRSA